MNEKKINASNNINNLFLLINYILLLREHDKKNIDK